MEVDFVGGGVDALGFHVGYLLLQIEIGKFTGVTRKELKVLRCFRDGRWHFDFLAGHLSVRQETPFYGLFYLPFLAVPAPTGKLDKPLQAKIPIEKKYRDAFKGVCVGVEVVDIDETAVSTDPDVSVSE